MERSYRFAIVRVVPDEWRGEALNVGIATLGPDADVQVHLLPTMRKVRAVNAAFDADAIRDVPQIIEKWLTNWSAERQPAGMQAIGPVTIEEIGEFLASAEDEYARTVDDLMMKLVNPVPRIRRRSVRTTRIKTLLRNEFQRRNLMGKEASDLKRGLFVPHFPINENQDLYVDYARENGVLHLIETIDLRVRKDQLRNKHNEACGIAVTFDTADKMFHRNRRKTVLFADDPEMDDDITAHLTLLQQHADELLNTRSSSDLNFFFRNLEVPSDGARLISN